MPSPTPNQAPSTQHRAGTGRLAASAVVLALLAGFAAGWFARGTTDGSQAPEWFDVADQLPPESERPELLPRYTGGQALAVFRDGAHSTLVADSASYFRRPAWSERRIPWPEHHDGEFVVATRERGLRLTGPLPQHRPDPLVVLVGDSHMEGVCSNDETAAAFLERALARDPSREHARVLNAATGMFSFPHYLGMAWRYLQLEPDAFVMVVYGGNDFGALETDEAEVRGERKPQRPEGYNERLALALEQQVAGREAGPSLWQFLNQTLLFAVDPSRMEWALEQSLAYAREISRLAEASGTRFVVVYLPPASDVHPDLVRALHAPLVDLLELEPEDLSLTDQLADRFLAGLDELEIERLDARPVLRGAGEPTFWIADEHVNVAGLRLLGEAVAERLARPREAR